MRFEHVISIGQSCPTAAELSRYGLRDGSYPLDWVICEIATATEYLETGFAGMLTADDLEREELRPSIVRSTRTGTRFVHDFNQDDPIDEQLPAVQQKYDRRIRRLLEAAKEPTLFVRRIEHQREFDWLNDNLGRVERAIRKFNPKNELLLVAHNSMPNECGGSRVYLVERIGDEGSWDFVRTNRALHYRLTLLQYPLIKRVRNLSRQWNTHGLDVLAHRTRLISRKLIVLTIGEDAFRKIRSQIR